jgi:hypothetical protein
MPASAKIAAARPGNQIIVTDDNGRHRQLVGRGDYGEIAPDGSAVAIGALFSLAPLQLVQLAGLKAARRLPLPCDLGVEWAANSKQILCVSVEPVAQHRIDAVSGAELPLPAGAEECRFAPDSASIACLTASGEFHLVDAVTGVGRVIESGTTVHELAFSPDSKQIAYTVGKRDNFGRGGRLTVRTLATGAVRRLAGIDVTSLLFGPKAIAFTIPTRYPASGTRTDLVFNVAVVNRTATGLRRLTHLRRPRVERNGLVPVAWSANGRRLVAVYLGASLNEAYAIDAVHGGARRIARGRLNLVHFSRDGKVLSGDTASHSGDPDSPSLHNVIRVGWAPGAKPVVLIRHAVRPSFSG